jgi:signal transduction histidine kinase
MSIQEPVRTSTTGPRPAAQAVAGTTQRAAGATDPSGPALRTFATDRAAHRRDALVVATVTIITWVLCGLFNVTEALQRLTAPYERYQLDELPTVLLVLSLGLTWFAARRYHEAKTEIGLRKSAQAQLAAALAENRRLAQQYVALQEAERKSLARELHDELGQYLNVIKLDAVGIRDARIPDLDVARNRAAAIVEHCNHIHAALATLIRALRPPGLDELGLAAALEHCVQLWRVRLPTLALRLVIEGELSELPEEISVTLFRLAQEGLTNVAKHSAATHAEVRVTRTGIDPSTPASVSITITDDGIGRAAGDDSTGLGLIGMRERVYALRGTLEVANAPGPGFVLSAHIPLLPEISPS